MWETKILSVINTKPAQKLTEIVEGNSNRDIEMNKRAAKKNRAIETHFSTHTHTHIAEAVASASQNEK